MNSTSLPYSTDASSTLMSTVNHLLFKHPLIIFCREPRTRGDELASLEVTGRMRSWRISIEPALHERSNFAKTSVSIMSPYLSRYEEEPQRTASTLFSLVACTLPERDTSGMAKSTPQYRAATFPSNSSLAVFDLRKLWRSSRLISKKDYETILALRSRVFYGVSEQPPWQHTNSTVKMITTEVHSYSPLTPPDASMKASSMLRGTILKIATRGF